MKGMTLGSLFDGSGGFPLAGAMNGMTPVWASEIEPYPLRVTAARFPHMKQLGDVTKIDGAAIDPVDVITFGSPCQDLSVAGKQTGIHDGKRSSLFFEAVRIIREMRGATNGKYPRFAVWENVLGAFSSNRGADFRAVLQALCEVRGKAVSVPEPPKGKWAKAGCIVGDGYSIAWRVYDAQYWGVPQRRKRIYLVADFGSERAGEILFERESVHGDSAQGGEAREGTADDAEGSAGGSSFFEPRSLMEENWSKQNIKNALRAEASKSSHVVVCSFMGGQGFKAGGIGYSEKVSPTLKSVLSGSNTVPDVVYPEKARTLAARHDSSPCVDRGQNVVALDCRNLIGNADISGTLQAKNEGGFSLNFVNPVVYDCRGNGSGHTVPNLTGDHPNRVTDYTAICLQGNGIDRADTAGCNGCGWRLGEAYTLNTIDRHAVCVGNGQMHQTELGDKTGALNCMHDQQAVIHGAKPPRRYIVRRLTPLECCRLQGFPDWWEDGVNGSDSARYKMWGNGIALPCAADVMRRIADECKICAPLHNAALDLHIKPVLEL